MLRIREEQFVQMEWNRQREVLTEIQHKAERLLSTYWPCRCRESTASDRKVLVAQSVEKAGQYGLVQAEQILTFLNAQMALGVDFDQDSRSAGIRDVLTSSLPADAKISRLVDEVQAELQRRMGR